MTTNWQIDKDFLQAALAKGKINIKNPNLSKNKKSLLRYSVATFKRFLNDNFENHDTDTSRPPKDLDKLKDYILKKMQKQYKTLGPKLINWLMDLAEAEIFDMHIFSDSTDLSLAEQIELTIRTYERNSPKFLNLAKEILLDTKTPQIQLVDRLDSSSYTHYDAITELPFIIIDPTEAPWILTHETEHAIEFIKKYPTHYLYEELGAHYFEMLATDTLYNQNGHIELGDFQDRVDDAEFYLSTLLGYFQIMQSFATKNFDISTKEFINSFMEIQEISPDNIQQYLKEEIATGEQEYNMTYLLSFLKAIELREQAMHQKNDSANILEPILANKRFRFELPQDGYNTYERYVTEMHQKVKSKK